MTETERPQKAIQYSTENMPFGCWITKERIQNTQNIHGNSGCMKAPWGYIIGTLPVLLEIMVSGSLSHDPNTQKLF